MQAEIEHSLFFIVEINLRPAYPFSSPSSLTVKVGLCLKQPSLYNIHSVALGCTYRKLRKNKKRAWPPSPPCPGKSLHEPMPIGVGGGGFQSSLTIRQTVPMTYTGSQKVQYCYTILLVRLQWIWVKHSLLPEPGIYLSLITHLQPRQTCSSFLNPLFESRTLSSPHSAFQWQVEAFQPTAHHSGSTDTILEFPSCPPLWITNWLTIWLTDGWSILHSII